MRVTVLGAGAWGTALAIRAAALGHATCLWARRPDQILLWEQARQNTTYLPGVRWPDSLKGRAGSIAQAVQPTDLVLIASPMSGLRPLLTELASIFPCHTKESPVVVWTCKGVEAETGALGHEIQAQVLPHLICGVLSGPSFAQEVAHGQFTALVMASAHERARKTVFQVFHSSVLRLYQSTDVIGVEVGGAVKNILAIATGLCDGLHLGDNARAALITRGLEETTRFATALGAKASTLVGLSGLGDLVLTATGQLSRNRQVGLRLAQGQPLASILHDLGHVAEGVRCVQSVWQRAQSMKVAMPVVEAMWAVLQGQQHPQDAAALLMQRPATWESQTLGDLGNISEAC
jgi:glycerol-3-phosphate dehydrogenase (NAD(P)+)